MAVRRLCIKTCIEYTQPARYELIADFGARAARIAGNYAHIYLELEKNGKPQLKRRFYWTGLDWTGCVCQQASHVCIGLYLADQNENGPFYGSILGPFKAVLGHG